MSDWEFRQDEIRYKNLRILNTSCEKYLRIVERFYLGFEIKNKFFWFYIWFVRFFNEKLFLVFSWSMKLFLIFLVIGRKEGLKRERIWRIWNVISDKLLLKRQSETKKLELHRGVSFWNLISIEKNILSYFLNLKEFLLIFQK